MKSLIVKHKLLVLILVLGFALRLISLNQSFWLDEAINIVYARSSDLWWFVTKYPIGDFHPPGWFAIIWIWGHIFGFSEVTSRLPSVFFGVATVWLTYQLGKELFNEQVLSLGNRKVGLLASIFLAIAPLHVYYSQEARMYAFAAFSVTLSFYFLNRITQGKKWAGLGYAVSLVSVLYSDYLTYFIFPAQIVFLLWVRKFNRVALIAVLTSGLAFLPWLSIFPTQFKTGMNFAMDLPVWSKVVGSSLKDLLLVPVKILFGRVSFSDKTFYVIVSGLVGTIFVGIFIYGIKKIDQSTKLLLSWIFVPLILAFLISFFIPVLAYFRMIFILPAVYLILAKGIESLPKKFAMTAIVFICLVSLSSIFAYYLNPKFQREDWRGAVSFVSHNLNNQSLVIFENNEIPAPVRYYIDDLSNFRPGLSENLMSELVGKNKVFVFEYLVGIYDPKRLVEQKLKDLNFVETKTYDFQGVGFIKLYVK